MQINLFCSCCQLLFLACYASKLNDAISLTPRKSLTHAPIHICTKGAKLKNLQDTQSAPQSTLGPKHGKVSQLRDSVTAASSRPGTISPYGTVSAVKIDSGAELQRYNEVYERLRKLLETERRHTREAKAAHMKLLTNRTELEGMLRECVDEMKEEAGISTNDADRDPTGHGLSKEDRERVLELLLSQEKAIAQLYGESFRSTAPSVRTFCNHCSWCVLRESERLC